MRLDDEGRDAVALRLAEIACEAGRLLRRRQAATIEHTVKSDGTPSTAADLEAERLILDRLRQVWPGVPAVAEESADAAPTGELFFLVGPLDGTSDYLHRTGEYSVNVALVAGERPVAAAIMIPALDKVWAAGASARVGEARGDAPPSTWREVRTRPVPRDGLVALVSRRHGDEATEACLAALPIRERRTASSALKFCLVASGEADLYVRCGPTMEWDTAAGDHILACAGGRVVSSGNAPMTYGHRSRGYRNGPFAALGDPALALRLELPLGMPEG